MLGRQIPISQLTVDAACPLEIGDWRVLPPPLYVPHLVVSIKAPQEVSRGGTLRYEVTILNSSGTPYRLEPCPVFVQQLAGQAAAHQLNCAVPTIKAHSSVRFEMQVSVPSNTPVGESKLTWMAVVSDGRVAVADLATGGVTVRITG